VQMRCIKSLKGVTQLSVTVGFKYRRPPGFVFEGLTEDQFCIRWYRMAILDFRGLPLQKVSVRPSNKHSIWGEKLFDTGRMGRAGQLARDIERQLLDPEGLQRWEERREKERQATRDEQRARCCHRGSTEDKCVQQRQRRRHVRHDPAGRASRSLRHCRVTHVCLFCNRRNSIRLLRARDAVACTRLGRCNEPLSSIS
jgi:hypothetical protein